MAFNKKERERIHQKLAGHCGYCGKEITLKEMQVDHMNPVSLKYAKDAFGEYKINDYGHDTNLMPTCRRCNHYKRADTVEQFRLSMKTLHNRLTKIYIVNVGLDFGMMKIEPFDGTFYFERDGKKV